ncbi:hypothetical protein ACWIGI_07245 [Nocardia sp. NPDC055321]
MMFDAGPFLIVVSMPRVHPGWFLGVFTAVLGFGVLVMLVVATSCGGAEAVNGPSSTGIPATAGPGSCEPFCGHGRTG